MTSSEAASTPYLAREEYRDRILRLYRGRVDRHLQALAAEDPSEPNFKGIAEATAHQYGDRFLLELLQNAHDALDPMRSDGRIGVVLDGDQGPAGTLYIANGGRPFNHSNFKALSNIAASDKPPGQGIGNKGVGFRSVFRVCQRPDVFSAASSDQPAADGYCFRFATKADVDHLSPEHADVIWRDIHPSRLPVPMATEERDPTVDRLFNDGFVTVLRLELDNEAAYELADQEAAKLEQHAWRTILFLTRVNELTVEHGARTSRLTRQVVEAKSFGDVDYEHIKVLDREFHVFERGVNEQSVKAAIDSARDQHMIASSWEDWSGEATLRIAVPVGSSEPDAGRFYAGLPMEQETPFSGHLDAPFYTRLDRRDADLDVPLNALWMRTGAELAAAAADWIAKEGIDSNAAVDLLSWDVEHCDLLVEAAGRLELELQLPVVNQNGEGWAASAAVMIWPLSTPYVLTPQLVGAHVQRPVLRATVDHQRRQLLMPLLDATTISGPYLAPDDIGHLAEAVALAVLEDAEEWNGFYADLEALLSDEPSTSQVLSGRRILLDEHGTLRGAGPWERDDPGTRVYRRPIRRGTETAIDDDDLSDEDDFSLPASLSASVCLLHPSIEVRHQRTEPAPPARRLLDKFKLVRPYRAHDLLEHVAAIGGQDDSDDVRFDALDFVLDRFVRAGGHLESLRELGLHVPTRGGWRPAEEAVVGGGWGSDLGDDLDVFLSDPPVTQDPLFEQLDRRVLLRPDEIPTSDEESLIELFREAGTSQGVVPVLTQLGRVLQRAGRHLAGITTSGSLPLSETARTFWSKAVEEATSGPGRVPYATVQYSSSRDLWQLPGVAMHETWPESTRLTYASLLAAGLPYWISAEQGKFVWRRTGRRQSQDPRHTEIWPSPARAFVAHESWLPVERADRVGTVSFASVSEAWDAETGKRRSAAPATAKVVQRTLRSRLGNPERRALRALGQPSWDEPTHALRRLKELAVLAGETGQRQETDSIVRACRDAWSDLLNQEHLTRLPDTIVVTRAGELDVVDADTGPVLVPADERGGFIQALLPLTSRPVVVSDLGDADAVRDALANQGWEVTSAAELNPSVLVDGRPLEEVAGVDLVASDASWFATLLAVVIEVRSTARETFGEEGIAERLDHLRAVKLVTFDELNIQIEDESLTALPDHLKNVFAMPSSLGGVLLVKGPFQLDWSGLATISRALADLMRVPAFADRFELVGRRLSDLDVPFELPTDSQLADVLRVSRNTVAAAREHWATDATALAYRVVPVVAHRFGTGVALDVWRGEHHADALHQALVSLLGEVDASHLLEEAETAPSPAELLRSRGVSFHETQVLLDELPAPWEPKDTRAHHTDQLRRALRRLEPEIADALRAPHRDAYAEFRIIEEYVASRRTLPPTDPPDDWRLHYEDVPEEAIRSWVDDWLDRQGGRPLGNRTGLPPVAEARTHNLNELREIHARLGAILQGRSTRDEVSLTIPPADEMSDRLLDVGAFDFTCLSTSEVIRWLEELGLWPADVPASLDLAAHGLTAEDLAAGEEARKKQQAEERKRRRSVEVLGTSLDTAGMDPAELGRRLSELLPAPGEDAIRDIELESISPRSPGGDGGGGGGGRGGSRRPNFRPAEEPDVVGKLGELRAYHTLQRTFGSEAVRWVSSNRTILLHDGDMGDDSLGYDFEVDDGDKLMRIEVKASRGQVDEIRLTPREFELARASLPGRYRILLVTGLAHPDHIDQGLLPNPLEDDVAERFDLAPDGFVVRFKRRTPSE